MKDIEIVSDTIEAKINNAEEHIRCAINFHKTRPLLAEAYYKTANDELEHVKLFHTQVVSIIDEYNKSGKETPEAMKKLYEILHRKHIEHMATVKGMMALYKEQ